jgi:hypothetical protein
MNKNNFKWRVLKIMFFNMTREDKLMKRNYYHRLIIE